MLKSIEMNMFQIRSENVSVHFTSQILLLIIFVIKYPSDALASEWTDRRILYVNQNRSTKITLNTFLF